MFIEMKLKIQKYFKVCVCERERERDTCRVYVSTADTEIIHHL